MKQFHLTDIYKKTNIIKYRMEGCIPIFYQDKLDGSQNKSVFRYQPKAALMPNFTMVLDDDSDFRSENDSYEHVELILYKYIVPFIAVFGIIGNLLNLIVLTRKSLQKTMDRMEKSAHIGLMALAVSFLSKKPNITKTRFEGAQKS